jgi:serine/threonine protein kinase/Flp pilus assembly protein TadD
VEPVRFGKYQLLKKIAVGGMAELYQAKITGVQGFEKLIAIKRLLPHLTSDEELIRAFIDEARLAAYLQHQNIIQIYDFGCMEGRYFIAMEFLFGQDLRSVIQRAEKIGRPLSLTHSLYVVSRICEGLHYSHQLTDFNNQPLHIIHRDISPPNILITYEGEVKIVDFGIAKAAGRISTTQVGKIKGKIPYMSPEQAEGEEIDHRSDIFSAGILLYEMIGRRRMFQGDAFQVLAKVRRAAFDPPEAFDIDIPPAVMRVIQRALAKEPNLRYQSAGNMQADVEACLSQMRFRPSSRTLAVYMRELFHGETVLALNQAQAEIADTPKPAGDADGPPSVRSHDHPAAHTATVAVDTPTDRKGHTVRRVALLALLLLLAGVGGSRAFNQWSLKHNLDEALTAVEASKYNEAVKLFEAVIQAQPQMRPQIADAYMVALHAYAAQIKLEDPSVAEQLLQRSVALMPQDYRGHFKLGRLYLASTNFNKAIKAFQQAILLAPELDEGFFNLGYAYAMIEAFDQAEAMYQQALRLEPAYIDEIHFNLAVIQQRLGKPGEAIENLEKAIQANPGNEPAHSFLAHVRAQRLVSNQEEYIE